MLLSGKFFQKILLHFVCYLIITFAVNIPADATNLHDSCYCSGQINEYRNHFKLKNYEHALSVWHNVVINCPFDDIKTQFEGACIYTRIAETTIDNSRRDACIDTLYILAQNLISSSSDSLLPINQNFSCNNVITDSLKCTYKAQLLTLFSNIFRLAGNKTNPYLASAYFNTIYNQVCKAELPVDSLIDAYYTVKKLALFNLNSGTCDSTALSNWQTINMQFDKQMLTLPDHIQPLQVLSVQLKKKSSDVTLTDKIIILSEALQRTDTPLYSSAISSLYKLNPNGESALMMGKFALMNNLMPEAESYFLEAIPKLDANQRAQAYYYLAETYFEMRRYHEARTYANKSIRNNCSDGKSYMLMGRIYVACAANQLSVQKATNSGYYWAAVDKFVKAKNCDPLLNEQANQYIAMYSMYFPSSEQLIFNGLKEGSTINTGNWLNETTTVRAAP